MSRAIHTPHWHDSWLDFVPSHLWSNKTNYALQLKWSNAVCKGSTKNTKQFKETLILYSNNVSEFMFYTLGHLLVPYYTTSCSILQQGLQTFATCPQQCRNLSRWIARGFAPKRVPTHRVRTHIDSTVVIKCLNFSFSYRAKKDYIASKMKQNHIKHVYFSFLNLLKVKTTRNKKCSWWVQRCELGTRAFHNHTSKFANLVEAIFPRRFYVDVSLLHFLRFFLFHIWKPLAFGAYNLIVAISNKFLFSLKTKE